MMPITYHYDKFPPENIDYLELLDCWNRLHRHYLDMMGFCPGSPMQNFYSVR